MSKETLNGLNGKANAMYEREDWIQFRSILTISQESGVPPEHLRRLVAKELADNALDCGSNCKVGELEGGGFYVEDDGPGIQGGPEKIARLFSFRRPLISSKLIRLPTRGALGNGLRVCVGAVFASGGKMRVITNGQSHDLAPQENGETLVRSEPSQRTTGTRIEVYFGDSVPEDAEHLEWAKTAIQAAGEKLIFSGKTSPFWYDSEAFWELLQSAGDRTVRDVMMQFDGCSGRAGEIAQRFLERTVKSLSLEEADVLLLRARSFCRPVNPKRLHLAKASIQGHHAKESGTLKLLPCRGNVAAELPFTGEAWCNRSCDDNDHITVMVNRTPVTGMVKIHRSNIKNFVLVFGCNVGHKFKVGRKPVDLILNIQIPHMPITSKGKEPDLRLFVDELSSAITAASNKCSRATASTRTTYQNQIILDNLSKAVGHASGDGKYRFSLRQLFYAVRPQLLKEFGDKEPGYNWFCKVISEFENDNADIPGLYRDDRGVIYHPHLRTVIPLGTLSVEEYERPKWTFNKILYCEKEGFFPILQSANWPERHDCALLTSKGQATKAAKDIIDLIGDTDEEILFYVIADADAYGSVIVESLQEATRARPARRVKIINLGLTPDEGLAMGLPVERVPKGKKRKPTGGHVSEKSANWLQTNRIELNAMTTPQFIAWLDAKMEEFGNGKIIPPIAAMNDFMNASVRKQLEDVIRDRILRQSAYDERVEEAMALLQAQISRRADSLYALVAASLTQDPEQSWRAPVEFGATELVRMSEN